jgi:uncharacterized membrane-anchored protein
VTTPMTSQSNKMVLALALVALAQTGVLVWMVADRLWLLRNGREIVLPIVPVDPRDLFRGDYVRLSYEASRLPARLLEGPQPTRHAPFYVMLESKSGEAWQPIKVIAGRPAESGPTHIVLKARTPYGWPQNPPAAATVWATYGIESYFVPQGQGSRLEALARDKKLAARIAVDRSGNAAIKGLMIDGVEQYAEPLF